MAKRTVLYLLDHTDLGGGETSFVDFLRAAKTRANEIKPVVILRSEGTVATALRELDVEVQFVDFPLRLRKGIVPWFSFSAKRKILTMIDRTKPDLVHANNFFGMLYGGAAARARGVPVVWTCHGWWELDKPIKAKIAKRFVSHIPCVSGAVKTEADRLLGGGVPTSIDFLGVTPLRENETAEDRRRVREEARKEFGISDDVKLLAVVGRFQPIKGHALLLAALPEILKKHPNLKVWFIGDSILGDADDVREKERLKNIVHEKKWENIVQFLGWRGDARRLMRALDLLAVPSERESFCMAAVEGLEAGVPVVGPNGWGPKEIIQDPETGKLFASGDSGDLAQKIILILNGHSGFNPESGPQRVINSFSAQAHLDRCIGIYQSVSK